MIRLFEEVSKRCPESALFEIRHAHDHRPVGIAGEVHKAEAVIEGTHLLIKRMVAFDCSIQRAQLVAWERGENQVSLADAPAPAPDLAVSTAAEPAPQESALERLIAQVRQFWAE
ncbi:MAG: hypothetical protein OEL53_17640 [Rhodospirillales bacterium]|nr:hypothetical protein [Rhodospirillales bacterium]